MFAISAQFNMPTSTSSASNTAAGKPDSFTVADTGTAKAEGKALFQPNLLSSEGKNTLLILGGSDSKKKDTSLVQDIIALYMATNALQQVNALSYVMNAVGAAEGGSGAVGGGISIAA